MPEKENLHEEVVGCAENGAANHLLVQKSG